MRPLILLFLFLTACGTSTKKEATTTDSSATAESVAKPDSVLKTKSHSVDSSRVAAKITDTIARSAPVATIAPPAPPVNIFADYIPKDPLVDEVMRNIGWQWKDAQSSSDEIRIGQVQSSDTYSLMEALGEYCSGRPGSASSALKMLRIGQSGKSTIQLMYDQLAEKYGSKKLWELACVSTLPEVTPDLGEASRNIEWQKNYGGKDPATIGSYERAKAAFAKNDYTRGMYELMNGQHGKYTIQASYRATFREHPQEFVKLFE